MRDGRNTGKEINNEIKQEPMFSIKSVTLEAITSGDLKRVEKEFHFYQTIL